MRGKSKSEANLPGRRVNKREEAPHKYTMTISRLTVDKLGVKLYDRLSAVLAELVANSYDADATLVRIEAPMDEMLALKEKGRITDRGFTVEIMDNGHGMTPEEINPFYLRVGAERREDPRRGSISPKYKRKVMGRKGVGKLAPFGICRRIEVITAGGDRIRGRDASGSLTEGFLTAHLTLDRNEILNESDFDYHPDAGVLDGTVSRDTGTTLKLTIFDHRRVPSITDLERQLSQRFGLPSAHWRIELIDSLEPKGSKDRRRVVGAFPATTMPGTRLRFEPAKDSPSQVVNDEGSVISSLQPGFSHDGRFYPISGWMAYARDPYKDDLMAGVRVYCRGKIATQTYVFNQGAGFTGEYSIRSYLIGELHADWLDEEEDLIQTDRRDILWSSELGQEFEAWGRGIVRQIGKAARDPLKQRTWERFLELSKIADLVSEAFPLDDQAPIRKKALEFAKLIGQSVKDEELNDSEYVESLAQLSLLLAPHVILDDTLREAAETQDSPLTVVTSILRTARIAELSSFGRIADDRVKVITNLERLKDSEGTLEGAFQNLIAQAPWLIDPQWSPMTSNQSFSTLRREFVKYFKRETGEDIKLNDFSDPKKRSDFVFSNQDDTLEIVEIKRPFHALTNAEMDRVDLYWRLMEQFLDDPASQEFRRRFPKVHITLVCDELALKGVTRTAFDGLKQQGALTHINWRTFLLRTRRAHEDFMNEAERQRRLALST
jgi:hypothetical protein